MSTALLTDRYEITMVRGALRSGRAATPVVFEVFTRALPPGRRFGVLAGTGRLLAALADFRFGPAELAYLRAAGVTDEATETFLAGFRFGGDIDGLAEGEPYLPGTPVLVVSGTFAECVLLETLVLSVLNHDSAIAAAAARMVAAAGGRPCIEMGSRRTEEHAAIAAARAAYIAGFATTSNLAAGRAYGVPTTGTAAHAFTLLHPSERAAFTAQAEALGVDTTLLVDTFDTQAGTDAAIDAAGPGLGAIRIDSGDLASAAVAARAQLDARGAHGTRIVVTGDLDEHVITELAAAPVDSYGVGTRLVTGAGAPTAGFVYKLVEVAGTPVAKTSIGKATVGGRKTVRRRHDEAGRAVADVIRLAAPSGDPAVVDAAGGGPTSGGPTSGGPTSAGEAGARPAGPWERELLVPLGRSGQVVRPDLTGPAGVERARRHHGEAMAALPPVTELDGGPCLPVVVATGAEEMPTAQARG